MREYKYSLKKKDFFNVDIELSFFNKEFFKSSLSAIIMTLVFIALLLLIFVIYLFFTNVNDFPVGLLVFLFAFLFIIALPVMLIALYLLKFCGSIILYLTNEDIPEHTLTIDSESDTFKIEDNNICIEYKWEGIKYFYNTKNYFVIFVSDGKAFASGSKAFVIPKRYLGSEEEKTQIEDIFNKKIDKLKKEHGKKFSYKSINMYNLAVVFPKDSGTLKNIGFGKNEEEKYCTIVSKEFENSEILLNEKPIKKEYIWTYDKEDNKVFMKDFFNFKITDKNGKNSNVTKSLGFILGFILFLITFSLLSFILLKITKNSAVILSIIVSWFISYILVIILSKLLFKLIAKFSEALSNKKFQDKKLDFRILVDSEANSFKIKQVDGTLKEIEWNNVVSIGKGESYLAIMLTQQKFIPIPKRIFENQEEMNSLWYIISENFSKNNSNII